MPGDHRIQYKTSVTSPIPASPRQNRAMLSPVVVVAPVLIIPVVVPGVLDVTVPSYIFHAVSSYSLRNVVIPDYNPGAAVVRRVVP